MSHGGSSSGTPGASISVDRERVDPAAARRHDADAISRGGWRSSCAWNGIPAASGRSAAPIANVLREAAAHQRQAPARERPGLHGPEAGVPRAAGDAPAGAAERIGVLGGRHGAGGRPRGVDDRLSRRRGPAAGRSPGPASASACRCQDDREVGSGSTPRRTTCCGSTIVCVGKFTLDVPRDQVRRGAARSMVIERADSSIRYRQVPVSTIRRKR